MSGNKVSTEEEPDDEKERMGGDQSFSVQEDDEEEEDKGPVRRCLQKTWVRFLIFVGLTGYGAVCVLFDWLWVKDMLYVEKALVFGPADTSTIIALIVVASVGTVAYGWEIVNNANKVCKKDPIMDEDLAQVVVLFVEEIPETILNVLLASCREMPISIYQLVKAGLGLLGAAIRVLSMLYHYLTPRRHGRRTGVIPWLLRTIIVCACAGVFAGSMLVFVYTFTEPPTNGTDVGDFRIPDTIIEKSYDKGRYLYRSGVYFSHPSFAGCHGNNVKWSNQSINWIKLEGLYEMMDTGDELGSITTFYYDTDATYIHIDTEFQPEVCFMTQLPSCDVMKMADCNAIPIGLDNIQLQFIHTDRSKTIVFGDIKVKALLNEGRCLEMSLDDRGYLLSDSEAKAKIQYFQATPGTNETSAYKSDGDQYSLYQVGTDLNYVIDAWLTGYRMCEMSGNIRPNWEETLSVEC